MERYLVIESVRYVCTQSSSGLSSKRPTKWIFTYNDDTTETVSAARVRK